MVRPDSMGPDVPNQSTAHVGIHHPLTRPRSLISSTANVQTGPELSEDRRREALGEDVSVL